MEKQPAVYIMANKRNGTLYTGVTSNLHKRVYEHKNKITRGFASQYNCSKLVCYVLFDAMEEAIKEEKKIKAGSRKKKLDLIEAMNANWEDLYDTLSI
ncbi:MAG: GIY-YIG nuclease family protein [Alphaproteobacteria bacterium]|nr:GIY-YIG nuclease family protein [Alphaproteobacteria bacterium]